MNDTPLDQYIAEQFAATRALYGDGAINWEFYRAVYGPLFQGRGE